MQPTQPPPPAPPPISAPANPVPPEPPAAGFAQHLAAVLTLPFVVTVVIPTVLVVRFGVDPFAWWDNAPITRWLLPVIGGAVIFAGLCLTVATISLFARRGRGTLAPWNPPRRLVVQGIYAHVRNPMITGVWALLLGETLIAASPALAAWFLIFAAANAVVIPLGEEKDLLKRFGDDYRLYRQNVPRWIPRRTPWIPPAANQPPPPADSKQSP
ncbi:MAG TPA: isoprenylcysteine carboxylmethyltransferase family protein [Planctomycetota bacterium]|nr:isoprenylcysteine carboxylmethyltransferase family protein [Planctomycetota bacterium]